MSTIKLLMYFQSIPCTPSRPCWVCSPCPFLQEGYALILHVLQKREFLLLSQRATACFSNSFSPKENTRLSSGFRLLCSHALSLFLDWTGTLLSSDSSAPLKEKKTKAKQKNPFSDHWYRTQVACLWRCKSLYLFLLHEQQVTENMALQISSTGRDIWAVTNAEYGCLCLNIVANTWFVHYLHSLSLPGLHWFSPRTSFDCHNFSNITEGGLATVSVNSLRTLGCILSGPLHLCMFRFPRWESGDRLQW